MSNFDSNNSDNKRTLTRLLTVDSKFKDEDNKKTTSHFQVTFPDRINKVKKMEIAEYSGPTAIRMLSSEQNNNFFTVTLKLTNGNSETKIIECPDTYRIERNIMNSTTVKNFITNINNQLLTAGGNFTHCSFQFDDDIEAAINLNDLVMDRTVSFVVDKGNAATVNEVILDFVTPKTGTNPLIFEKSLGYILGFRNNTVSTTTTIPVGNTTKFFIKAESVVDLNDFKYAYLIVDDFISNSESNIITSEIKSQGNCSGSLRHGGNILGKIIYRNELNYNFHNRVISTPREYYGSVDIQKLKVALVNEYGDYIDTKQLDWSFTLRLTSVV